MQASDEVQVRQIGPGDLGAWLGLRMKLWPGESIEVHREEALAWLGEGEGAARGIGFLAVGPSGQALGFAEASIRAMAEGCEAGEVAYLEGWYVVAESRRQGIGGMLVAAVESWGRSKGCSELASDTELENHMSRDSHTALGFEEVAVVRCFRKVIPDVPS